MALKKQKDEVGNRDDRTSISPIHPPLESVKDKTILKKVVIQPEESRRGELNNYSKMDSAKLKANEHHPEDDTTKTRINVVQSIKKMVGKTPSVTNPDETVRISILNKPTVGERIKRWSWLVLVILGVFLLFRSGIFQGSKKNKEAPLEEISPVGNTSHSSETIHPNDKNELKNNSKGSVNYQVLGRGLVYNCRGKFWACIDKQNYINCRILSKTDKSCSTQGVFDTNSQCIRSMKSKPSDVREKSFCK
jgi:hypothetical protein